MEKNKKTPLLFLLLALPYVTLNDCPSPPDKNLTCYNDYNRIITCVWNSTYDHADTVCTINAERLHRINGYSNSCKLEPVDFSRPMLKKCTMVFKNKWRFQHFHKLTINLSCNTMKQSLSIPYLPYCHIKLNPPPKPDINFTTISWFPQVTKHMRIKRFNSELQWKQKDQPWSEPSFYKECIWDCKAQLPDDLIQDERYEARIRVQASEFLSTWSDWSPTASWVALIGRAKPTPPDVAGSVLGTFAFVVAFAVLIILIKTDKTTWIYIVKRLRGPPLPNPGKSFLQDVNFQTFLSPHFTSETFHSFLKPVEIVSVEVTSTVDAVAPSKPEATLQGKMRSKSSQESTSSSFSNPIYSQLTPPPVFSLAVGNLKACDADTPYGPVRCQGDSKNAEQDRDEVRGKEVAIVQLLSKGSNNSEPMPVISDYEKVERPQMERFRLHSLDSGVCSGEEVSQESLEADSINVTDCHDEGPEGKEETEGGSGEKIDFQKLFGGSGGIYDKGSIQACSGYEQVQKLQADSPELPSLDSGISSGGEEQVSQEESLEDFDKPTESTCLLFSPLPSSSALECSLPSFTPLPLNFSGASLSPAVRPLPSHILERIALMSTNKSVEPSGDGYMAVSQEHS